MASLVKSDMYGAINTHETTTSGFYVIQLISEAYTLHNIAQIYGQVISSGELVFKAQYICSMQENANWYYKQQSLKQTIMVPTRTIIHQRLYVEIIRCVQDIPNNFCNIIYKKDPYKDILFV